MKKIIVVLLIVMIIISGCDKEGKEKDILITREEYDELLAAKVENDKLKLDIDYLESKLDANVIENQVGAGDTDIVGIDLEESDSIDITAEEIEKLDLIPFQGEYGLYGYKDQTGRVIISANFDQASNYNGNKAEIRYGGKTGTIDKAGRLTWIKAETYKEAVLEPVNDMKEGSEFAIFIAEFKKALKTEDEEYIKSHIHPDIQISSDGHIGWSGLASYWSLDESDTAFYRVLNSTLKYGLVNMSEGNAEIYIAPYVFWNFPDDYDNLTFSVCVGSGVNVRNKPTTDSKILTQLTYNIVKVLGEENNWTKIQMPNGDRGYVSSTYIRSPIGYRARFIKKNEGEWYLDLFMKGE